MLLWTIALFVTIPTTFYVYTAIATPGLIRGVISDNDSVLTSSTTAIPDYFQTSPEIFPGPTSTARIAPFLAQTNPVIGSGTSIIPNTPLETTAPIAGNASDGNVFKFMGHLSPYFPSPGFGSGEYSLPPGTNISQVHVLHRHGSRYPTSDSGVSSFGAKIHDITKNDTAQWSGGLEFLNTWTYQLGAEILVPKGRQELFDSGVLHYYNYGQLYNTSSKIIARTTTQDRMLKSAEYFMAGFFGLEWTHNVSIEVQIEQPSYNTSLAGYLHCPNSNNFRSAGGRNASLTWERIYLANATQRLRALSGDYDWTISDSYNAQTLCPYETVAFGYSHWCTLFTYEEWQGFEYSIDLQFFGNNAFGSPTGRSVGIGYVQELYARLQNHLYQLEPGATNVNYTLDTMEVTFPLNQTLYFDFSHDTNIMSILTALGLRQFADTLSATSVSSDRALIVSHMTPFGARVAFEVIRSPAPVKNKRPSSQDATHADYYDRGDATTYIHLTLGQRTVPLYRSFPACGPRDDGWCDMTTFMSVLSNTLAAAQYEHSCFGAYEAVPYGDITDGVPITKKRGMAI